jgi:hypothetical protein
MKSSMIAVGVAVALAGCSSVGDSNMFASKEKTVEYYRVFDIKTAAAGQEVVKAATDGINRNVNNATLDTPAGAEVQEQPGHFKMTDPASAPPGAAVARGPSCEGAAWTAKAAPQVRGGENMNMIACLFPYKNGYHLDMYAVFTKREGGWLEWPRRMTGKVMGTPEGWTDKAMNDVVRTIRETTGAEVALVEAKPEVAGTPWLESTGGTGGAKTSK